MEPKLLRTDSRQRVWVSRERREAILEEFDKSGASAMRFAAYVGIKYPTFARCDAYGAPEIATSETYDRSQGLGCSATRLRNSVEPVENPITAGAFTRRSQRYPVCW